MLQEAMTLDFENYVSECPTDPIAMDADEYRLDAFCILQIKNDELPRVIFRAERPGMPRTRYQRLSVNLRLKENPSDFEFTKIHVYHNGCVSTAPGECAFTLTGSGRLLRNATQVLSPLTWEPSPPGIGLWDGKLAPRLIWPLGESAAADIVECAVTSVIMKGAEDHIPVLTSIITEDTPSEVLAEASADPRLAAKVFSEQLPARLALAKAYLTHFEQKRRRDLGDPDVFAEDDDNESVASTDTAPGMRTRRRAAAAAAKKLKKPKVKKLRTFSFELGDMVWLSAPLRTDDETKGGLPKKFKFRWIGPLRVVGYSRDQNRYTLVETLPDGRLLPRTANAARLRPYHTRKPLGSAEHAAIDCHTDDFEAEIKAWEKLRLAFKRPNIKVQPGVNREMFRRFDPEVVDANPADPEYQIERIVYHNYYRDLNTYKYTVKWLGHGTHRNMEFAEQDLHPKLIEDYWNTVVRIRSPQEYTKRLSYLRRHPQVLKRRRIPKALALTTPADNEGFDDPIPQVNNTPPADKIPSPVNDQAPNVAQGAQGLYPAQPQDIDELPLALDSFCDESTAPESEHLTPGEIDDLPRHAPLALEF
ncbi:hypothetical protein HDU96_003554 [Phlyctochytrium bullatum]|nr:hypothetical protein HDU96_003554 [Phlyctochytrium bullatum]